MENQTVATIKRVGTTIALIGSPLLLALGFGLHPAEGKTAAEQLQIIADNPVAWNVAHLALTFSVVLFIPVMLRLLALLQGRGAWFGLVGGALVTVGAIFLGALMGTDAFAGSALASVPVEQRAGLAVGAQALHDGAGLASAVLFSIAFVLGSFILAVGLFVAGTLPRWISAILALGAVVLFFNDASTLAGAAGGVIWLVGFGALALQDLRAGVTVSASTGRATQSTATARA